MAAGVVVLVVAMALGYFLWQFLQAQNDPNKAARITSKIAALLELPAGEEPQVAQVTDPEKLKTNPFFVDAQKDDFMVIYEKAKLAILYREASNKLIRVDFVELTPGTESN